MQRVRGLFLKKNVDNTFSGKVETFATDLFKVFVKQAWVDSPIMPLIANSPAEWKAQDPGTEYTPFPFSLFRFSGDKQIRGHAYHPGPVVRRVDNFIQRIKFVRCHV